MSASHSTLPDRRMSRKYSSLRIAGIMASVLRARVVRDIYMSGSRPGLLLVVEGLSQIPVFARKAVPRAILRERNAQG